MQINVPDALYIHVLWATIARLKVLISAKSKSTKIESIFVKAKKLPKSCTSLLRGFTLLLSPF